LITYNGLRGYANWFADGPFVFTASSNIDLANINGINAATLVDSCSPQSNVKAIGYASNVDEIQSDLYQAEKPIDAQHGTAALTATLGLKRALADQQMGLGLLPDGTKGFEVEMEAQDFCDFLLKHDGGCKRIRMVCPYDLFPLPSMTLEFASSKERLEPSNTLCVGILKHIVTNGAAKDDLE